MALIGIVTTKRKLKRCWCFNLIFYFYAYVIFLHSEIEWWGKIEANFVHATVLKNMIEEFYLDAFALQAEEIQIEYMFLSYVASRRGAASFS